MSLPERLAIKKARARVQPASDIFIVEGTTGNDDGFNALIGLMGDRARGDIVEKGEEVGVIYSPRTFEVVERLVASQDGYIFSVRENPVVNAGDRVVAVPEIIEAMEN